MAQCGHWKGVGVVLGPLSGSGPPVTTFPQPPAEPPTTPHDVRRWILVGIVWGVVFLFAVAWVMHALGIE